MNTIGMRPVIVCRKSVLVPVIPELSNGHYDYEEAKALKLVLHASGQPAHDGRVSVPVEVWRKKRLQRFFRPLATKLPTQKRPEAKPRIRSAAKKTTARKGKR